MYATDHTNHEILALLDNEVYGHTRAKKVLINALNRSKIRWHQIHSFGVDPSKAIELKNVFLLGASGSGKTFLIETLTNICDVPFLKFDATQISPAGGKGNLCVDEIIKEIQVHCSHAAQQSKGLYTAAEVMNSVVVMIDEADKLARSFDSSGNWNKQVQSNLLQLIDGKTAISGVTFIFAGAFAETLQNEQKKDASAAIGFSRKKEVEKEKDWDEIITCLLYTSPSPRDLSTSRMPSSA